MKNRYLYTLSFVVGLCSALFLGVIPAFAFTDGFEDFADNYDLSTEDLYSDGNALDDRAHAGTKSASKSFEIDWNITDHNTVVEYDFYVYVATTTSQNFAYLFGDSNNDHAGSAPTERYFTLNSYQDDLYYYTTAFSAKTKILDNTFDAFEWHYIGIIFDCVLDRV